MLVDNWEDEPGALGSEVAGVLEQSVRLEAAEIGFDHPLDTDSTTREEHAGGGARRASLPSLTPATPTMANAYPRNYYPAWDLSYRRYTRDGMKEHLENHGKIYKLMSQAGGGVQ